MSTEPASALHRFVSLANEPDYLAIGWMRERPLRPPVQNFGVWLIWPCTTCLPVEPPSGAVCGGWWPRCVPLPPPAAMERVTAVADKRGMVVGELLEGTAEER
jgi:hypothetical protein